MFDFTSYTIGLANGNGGGSELPTLTNPATKSEIFLSKQAIDKNGNVITGTYSPPPPLPTLTDPANQGEIFLGKEAIDQNGNAIVGTYEPPAPLPVLTNPALADDIKLDKEAIDSDGNIIVGTYVPDTPESPYKVFTVAIDTTNSNPLTSVTYQDDAVGMTGGSADWDTMPIFKDIKPCVLKEGVVQYYLNPNDFTQKADGSPADITSGNDGDVMIEFPKTGYSIETNGDTLTVKITDEIDNPNFSYHAFSREKEGDREKLYIGTYLGSNISSKLRSVSGRNPTASVTLTNARNYAKANGNGYDLVSFYPLTFLQCLYLIKYKSLDSQTALGRGFVDGNTAVISTGGTNLKGMYFGEATGKQQMKFAGVEDFWGNLRWWIDGLYSNVSWNILTAYQNFNDTGSGYMNQGQGTNVNISGYQMTAQGTSTRGFISKSANGSETTYFCDDGGISSNGIPNFGGSWAYASRAGMFYLYVNFSASYSHATLGMRLMYL